MGIKQYIGYMLVGDHECKIQFLVGRKQLGLKELLPYALD